MKRKICVVTGTRAEYGIVYWLLKAIQAEPGMELQLVVTGAHLSPEFGLTYKTIEQDGFYIHAKVEMLLSSDTAVGISKSTGLGLIGFADAFDRLQPDLVVLLGDRYEIMAAAQAAMIGNIPIAHIAGGDTTEGAIDEAIRHSITKMAHLHFVTNEDALRRVRQMGENPNFIYNVGSLGIDGIKRLKLLNVQELEEQLDFRLKKRNVLITFHPVTLDARPSSEQAQELLDALDLLWPEVGLIFTKSNADTDGREINRMIERFVSTRSNTRLYDSLGQLRYFSAISHVDAVVGNSSSGLYEVPSFHKATVNIGDRQKGRLQASSVIHCQPVAQEIYAAIYKAFDMDCSRVVNPYGDGESSPRVIAVLKQITNYKTLLQKQFFEVHSDE